MIIINNVNLPLDTDFNNLSDIAARQLKVSKENIISSSLYKKAIDARRKSNIHFCCSIITKIKGNEQRAVKLSKNKNAAIFKEEKYEYIKTEVIPQNRPVIVGFGPAGMFAGLVLARAGLKPLIIERGADVDTRVLDVEAFFSGGKLNPNSNIQFGEGGAGTFSDGKLNSGIKNLRCKEVLKQLVLFGASKNILTDAKPHIGTDVLRGVVKKFREYLKSLGAEIRFNSLLEDIEINNNKICSIIVNGEKIPCDSLILAIGHSARDTFRMLNKRDVKLIRKPFSVGVRIEHLQSDINRALYGEFANHKALSSADYKLAVHLDNGRGVYTFCMCPGGEVVNASSEQNRIAVNGMSNAKRDKANANSAVLVDLKPDDFAGEDVLAGLKFQEQIEEKAYKIGGGAVPITTVGSLIYGRKAQIGSVKPSVRPNTCFVSLEEIYPDFIVGSLKEGIERFGKLIAGFDNEDAVITAPESRSSSPVRILRDEGGCSVSVKGLYPAGEGAGYAGGIMSAAVDGMKAAERLIGDIK